MLHVYKILTCLSLLSMFHGSYTASAQDESKRVVDLELHIAHPTEGQEIVGLRTVIQLEAENHGPDDLYEGDSIVINFPGSNTYPRFLERDLKKGERIKIFDEIVTSPQYNTYTLTAYLVEDLTKVAYQGRPFAESWIDPDSTNNIKSIRFSNVQNSTSIDEVSTESAIVMYPNPADQELYLQSGQELKGNYIIEIYTLSGRLVQQQNININGSKLVIPVQLLPEGIYTITLAKPDCTFFYTHKFIKR